MSVLRAVLPALAIVLLAGGCGGSSGASDASPTLAAGARCPSAAEIHTLAGGALGDESGGATISAIVCSGEWTAAAVEVAGAQPGRVALKWTDARWQPVLVGGGTGPCPQTLKGAPKVITHALACSNF